MVREFWQAVNQWYRRQVTYRWLVASWRTSQRFARFSKWLRTHTGTATRTLLCLVGLIAGVSVWRFGVSPTPGQLATYLVAVAAMIGGTTAIIFSISLFLLQGVGDLYSSKHLDDYANNWRDQQSIYAGVITITLLFFATAMYVVNQKSLSGASAAAIVIGSLTLIGAVFALIENQYELVRRKLTPASAIGFLEAQALAEVTSLQRSAKRLSQILEFGTPEEPNEVALAAAYALLVGPSFRRLGGQIETLIEVALKLAVRHESESGRRAIDAVGAVLKSYLDSRATSSSQALSNVAPLAIRSDSDSLLFLAFERMNSAGLQSLRSGDERLSVRIVMAYGVIAESASRVSYVWDARSENPILDSVVSYLNSYIIDAAKVPNVETVYQGARVLADVGGIVTATGPELTLVGLEERLRECAMVGLALTSIPIVDACTDGFLELIIEVFANTGVPRQGAVRGALYGIAHIGLNVINAIARGAIPSDWAGTWSTFRGYENLDGVLRSCWASYEAQPDADAKTQFRKDLLVCLDGLRTTLRDVSKVTEICDNLLASTVARLLSSVHEFITSLLKDQSFQSEVKDLWKRISWFAVLPYFFASNAKTFDASSLSFLDLTDFVARTGLSAVTELGDETIAKNCVDAIFGMARHALEKGSNEFGYAEPRIAIKGCYIGIVALRLGWDTFVDYCRDKVADFDAAYNEKYLRSLPKDVPEGFDVNSHNVMGLSYPDQLRRDLEAWKSRFEHERLDGAVDIRYDAEAMMYSMIRPADIEAFVAAVWG